MFTGLLVAEGAFEFVLGEDALGSRRQLSKSAVDELEQFSTRYAELVRQPSCSPRRITGRTGSRGGFGCASRRMMARRGAR